MVFVVFCLLSSNTLQVNSFLVSQLSPVYCMFSVLVKSWSNNYSNKFDVCNRIIESSGSLVQLFDFLDAHWSTNDTTNMIVDRPSLVLYDCTCSTIVFYYETCVRLHVSVRTNLDHSVEFSVPTAGLTLALLHV